MVFRCVIQYVPHVLQTLCGSIRDLSLSASHQEINLPGLCTSRGLNVNLAQRKPRETTLQLKHNFNSVFISYQPLLFLLGVCLYIFYLVVMNIFSFSFRISEAVWIKKLKTSQSWEECGRARVSKFYQITTNKQEMTVLKLVFLSLAIKEKEKLEDSMHEDVVGCVCILNVLFSV